VIYFHVPLLDTRGALMPMSLRWVRRRAVIIADDAPAGVAM
jgi:hypothetical protein